LIPIENEHKPPELDFGAFTENFSKIDELHNLKSLTPPLSEIFNQTQEMDYQNNNEPNLNDV
jgi:hypothetical protein